MNSTVQKYLSRRTDFDRWPLEGDSGKGARQVVVIPALAEVDTLPKTLESLVTNRSDEREQTLVVVVVNNRPPECASPEDIDSNRETLRWLRTYGDLGLRLAWVDAASPGRELSRKGGVGDARKIGLDHGLRVLYEADALRNALICLDADTHVEPTYLTSIREHFAHDAAWGATIPFAHRLEGGRDRRQAILLYEAHLRHYVLGLRYAGSPYAFHTVGSAMACSAQAYAAVGGMRKRQAAEDFYFLQDLAKTGRVDEVSGTTVHPSSRVSGRVPFGTGAYLTRHDDASPMESYAPECFDVLRSWLDTWNRNRSHDGAALVRLAQGIHSELAAFLRIEGFPSAWDKLHGNLQPDQGYRWFDGLKTLRLIHHLRDTAHPNVPLAEALRALPGRFGDAFEPVRGSIDDAGTICTATLQALRGVDSASRFNPVNAGH